MVVEDFTNFWEWLSGGAVFTNGAWLYFLLIGVSCLVLGVLVGYLVAVIRHGPFEAFYVCANVLFASVPDFLGTSPRRIFAIARLAAREALRRRVVIVAFVIFAVALLFGAWFINTGSDHPERVFVNFVMWGSQMLILLMVLLISAFSLPEDIKNRTIYTVATKPVRATEIILGRILGFAAVGTALLIVMAGLGLLFVTGNLNHSHELNLEVPTADNFVAVNPEETGRRISEFAIAEASTTVAEGHTHYVEVWEDVRDLDAPPPANPDAIISQQPRGDKIVYRHVHVRPHGGHTHTATVDPDTGHISISPAKGFFRARVPVYADRLVFYDQNGDPRITRNLETGQAVLDEQGRAKTEGLNVGETWTYRSYVSGGANLSRAEFLFSDFRPERFPDGEFIPLELTLAVFRSYIGNQEKRVSVGVRFESIPDDPDAAVCRSELLEFESDEFDVQVKGIPRELPGFVVSAQGKEIRNGYFNLFDDFAQNGRIKLILTCRDDSQYIGVARADVYFRAAESSYAFNFFKGFFGIWLQMLIVIVLAVGLSTLLSSPVAMLVAVAGLVFGFFSEGIREITLPDREGGGPIESFYRLISQQNMMVELENTPQVAVMKSVDMALQKILESVTYVIPDFGRLNFSEYVKYGYYVDNDRLLVAAAISFAFCLGMSVVAYFCLKTRELAG